MLGMRGAGEQLGAARGSIEIDTSQLDRVSVQVNRVGQNIRRSFDDSLRGVQRFTTGIKELRGELRAVGIAGGLLTGLGLRSAMDVRRFTAAFRAQLEDEEEAVALMAELTEQANRFGLEVTEAWQMARNLLPVLDGATDELDEWVLRAARLNTLDPMKNMGDAARALQEYIADQPMSLQRLFNVPPNVIAEAKAQFEDVGQQVDFILDRFGATEQAALEMANSWVGVRNEMNLILATGFGPLGDALQDNLPHLRRFLQYVRDTHPEVLQWGAAMAVAAATAAPMLLFLQRMISLFGTLKAMGALGALGTLGAIGGAIGVGTIGGIGAVRGIGQVTGDEEAKGYGLGDVVDDLRANLRRLGEVLATQGAKLAFEWAELRTAVESAVLKLTISLLKANVALARFAKRIYSLIPGQAGREMVAEADTQIGELVANIEQKERRLANVRNNALIQALGTAQQIFRIFGMTAPGEAAAEPEAAAGAGPGGESGGYSEEQLAVMRQYADDRLRIEEQYGQQITQITEQHASQRASIIADYERTIAREAEDWARERARAQQQLQRSIADANEDLARREAEWQADLNERIADIREDGAQRVERMQEDHNLRMEQLQRDHRVSLMEAASRLDARAVAEEQRRYRNQVRDAEQTLDRRIEQEQENQAERIAEAQEAHQKRIQDARRANRQRIQDLQDNFEEQRRIAEEDRAVRLQRMEEDHALQLQELDRSHAEQLRSLQRAKREELRTLHRSYYQQLSDLGRFASSYEETQRRHQDYSVQLFNRYWQQMHSTAQGYLDRLEEYVESQPPSRPAPNPPYSYQHGGPVTREGTYLLHRNEYVLSSDTMSMLNRAIGGDMTQRGLVAAVGGGRTINMGGINMPIHAAPGMDARDVAHEVERSLTQLFKELGQ